MSKMMRKTLWKNKKVAIAITTGILSLCIVGRAIRASLLVSKIYSSLEPIVEMIDQPTPKTFKGKTNSIVPPRNRSPKVFGLGLSKTSTTSWASAMSQLGYKTKHMDQSLTPYMHHGTEANLTGRYNNVDSVWDIPTAFYYKELYETYPNSKFVLTTRNSEKWYESFSKYLEFHMLPRFGCDYPLRIQKLFEMVYGSGTPQKSLWIANFEKHNRLVVDFFKSHDSSDRLLVIDVEESDKWGKLCKFLGDDAKEECSKASLQSFPHDNDSRNHAQSGNECKQQKPKTDHITTTGDVVSTLKSKEAYVTLLCDPAVDEQRDYVQMLLVLIASIRQFDKDRDIITLVYGDILEYQKRAIEVAGAKIIKVREFGREVSDRPDWRVPDEVSACFRAKLHAFSLPYDRIAYFDNDIIFNQDLSWLFKETKYIGIEGKKAPMNGGFFAANTSNQASVDLQDLFRSDAFHPATGWNDVGPIQDHPGGRVYDDWSFWCSYTDQGVLYYYFHMLTQQADILSERKRQKMFTHFTGKNKPFLHTPDSLDDVLPRLRSGVISWHRLQQETKKWFHGKIPLKDESRIFDLNRNRLERTKKLISGILSGARANGRVDDPRTEKEKKKRRLPGAKGETSQAKMRRSLKEKTNGKSSKSESKDPYDSTSKSKSKDPYDSTRKSKGESKGERKSRMHRSLKEKTNGKSSKSESKDPYDSTSKSKSESESKSKSKDPYDSTSKSKSESKGERKSRMRRSLMAKTNSKSTTSKENSSSKDTKSESKSESKDPYDSTSKSKSKDPYDSTRKSKGESKSERKNRMR